MKKTTLLPTIILMLLISCAPEEKTEASAAISETQKSFEKEAVEIATDPDFLLEQGYYLVKTDSEVIELLWVSQGSGEDFLRVAHSPNPGPGEMADWNPIPPIPLEAAGTGWSVVLPGFSGFSEETLLLTEKEGDTQISSILRKEDTETSVIVEKISLNEYYSKINQKADSEASEDLAGVEDTESQPSQEDLIRVFLDREETRDVDDDFRRLTVGFFEDAAYGPGGIHLTFSHPDGEKVKLIQSPEYSAMETCPFLADTDPFEPWINLPFILVWKGFYMEDEQGNDVEQKILVEYVEYKENKFAAAGFSDAFDVYEFVDQLIEVIRDEKWDMFQYLLNFPYKIPTTPIGPLTLNSMEDFLQYRPIILTKAMLTRIVNQEYSKIIVNSSGLGLGRGDLWIYPGKEGFEILSFSPSED